MKKLLENKLIVSLLVVLCLTILGLSGIKLTNYITDKKKEQFLKGLDEAEPFYFGDVDPEIVKQVENGTFETPEIIPGKYYLNGDVNNYYFWIRDDSTIELCCDDKYALFEKWYLEEADSLNDTTRSAIDQHMTKWDGPKPFTVYVSPMGEITLETEVQYYFEDSSYYATLRGGPRYIDEKTIGKWGIEGDFIRID